MFTGIVAVVGKIAAAAPKGDGLRLVVAPGALDITDIAIGDSVAVNGCCLTVVAKSGATLGFDVSAETLACTAGLDGNADVNLEKALRLSDRLGGHLMSGHVDGVGTVAESHVVAAARARALSHHAAVTAARSARRVRSGWHAFERPGVVRRGTRACTDAFGGGPAG